VYWHAEITINGHSQVIEYQCRLFSHGQSSVLGPYLHSHSYE